MSQSRQNESSSSRREWLRLAASSPVVLRACMYALVVGAVLIAINHGDALVRGELGMDRVLKMGLTVCVPYLVSTFSSVGALRQTDGAGARAETSPASGERAA